jgi:hypothetical protein
VGRRLAPRRIGVPPAAIVSRRMSLTTGERLGPYEVVAPIGAGAMGEVFRARDTRLERDVAIKLVAAGLAGDPELVRRFEQEARAAGALNHPNVLVVFDVGTHAGRPFLICELLDGETLGKRLTRGPLTARKAIDYAAQIARGLAAAHAKGIIHRDLKPDNLFVTRDGQIKILDFGLAKLAEQPFAGPQDRTHVLPTTAAMVIGTPAYMSPEQVRGEEVDHRSDLFAFGAILYEMLAGRRAFSGANAAIVMSAVVREEPPDIETADGRVPPALARIVRHCLEKDRAARVHSAHDLAFVLETLSGDWSTTSWPALRQAPGRRRLALPALALGLLLAGLLAGLVAGRAGRPGYSTPSYQRLTFRRGMLDAARFAPNGDVLYSAAWEGRPRAVFLQPAATPDALPLTLPAASLLAVSPTGELAIALECKDNPNGTCLGTLATTPVSGGAPRRLQDSVQQADWAPGGRQLALVHDDGTRAQLEFPPGTVLYATAGHISFPRVSPRGDRIAFFDHPNRVDDRGTLAVVDLAARKTILAKDLEGGAQGLAWAPGGKEVWFTAARTGLADRALYGVDLSGHERGIAAVPGSLTLQDIAADGRVLLTLDTSRPSIHGRAPGETSERDLSWLDWSILGDLSDDGSTILFDEEGRAAGTNYALCLRKTDGSPSTQLGQGSAEALSPDGRWALAKLPVEGAPYLLLPTQAGNPRTLPAHGLQLSPAGQAAWLPDSTRIVFVASAPRQAPAVWIQDIAGGAPRRVTPEGFEFKRARPVSPDGRYLFASPPNGTFTIFPLAGGPPRPLPPIAGPPVTPIRWSADGRHLFVRNSTMPLHISLVDVATGKTTPWMDIAPPDQTGERVTLWLSADGKSYAYNVERNLADLYLVTNLR